MPDMPHCNTMWQVFYLHFCPILISLTLVLKGWGGCDSILYGNWFIIFIIFLLLWASTGLFVLYLFQYVSYWKQIIIIFCMQFVKSCLCLKRNWRWCCYLWRWSVAWIFNWKRKRFIAFPNEFKNCTEWAKKYVCQIFYLFL